MFPKGKRVSRALFQGISNSGKLVSTPFFSLRMNINTSPQPSPERRGGNANRYSIVVSKAVAKKAVDRNKIRRRVSEALKKQEHSIPSNTIYILYAKKPILQATFKDIENSLHVIHRQSTV